MNIGDRIKKYEAASKTTLLHRSYIVLRVDGKAFHTFTKDMEKPFDKKLMEAMVSTGEKMAKEMMGFKLGYHQSDEFTFILTDTDTYESQMWFDAEVQKLCSITASMFSAYFNSAMGGTEAVFDCRAFNVPLDDIANVFIWRQRDWERNSIQMYARSFFSHKELHNKGHEEMHELLFSKGKNWSNLSEQEKNGTFITKGGRRINKKMTYEEINLIINQSSFIN
jgi:tRNA(His) 5'-end guanylyltransferase